MKLLVTGARDGFDQAQIDRYLGRYLHQFGDKLVIIEGCARGVDTQAWEWAKAHKVPVLHYPAPWSHLGKPAGRWRNLAMLRVLQPDRVVSFHATLHLSKGTKHMVEAAMKENVPTHMIGSGLA